jgi:hypothetical protein
MTVASRCSRYEGFQQASRNRILVMPPAMAPAAELHALGQGDDLPGAIRSGVRPYLRAAAWAPAVKPQLAGSLGDRRVPELPHAAEPSADELHATADRVAAGYLNRRRRAYVLADLQRAGTSVRWDVR